MCRTWTGRLVVLREHKRDDQTHREETGDDETDAPGVAPHLLALLETLEFLQTRLATGLLSFALAGAHGGETVSSGPRGAAVSNNDGVALIVQKYGGTSVADADRIRAVAEHVAFTRRQGHQ